MKRVLILLLTAFLLVSCGSDGKDPAETPSGESVPTGKTLPFAAAENGYYANGMLYYTDHGFVRYVNLDTGEDRVLCYDPLCTHDDETVTSDCQCIAYHAADGFTGRVLADGDRIWFLAEEQPGKIPGDFTTYYQLRCIDLDNMSLNVYLRTNEMHIYDFWMYGGEIYLSMPKEETDENGRLHYTGGSIYRLEKNGKLTMVLEDRDGGQYRLLDSGEDGVYYHAKFGNGELYRASADFSSSETAAVLNGVYNIRISGGYVYYMKKNGNSYNIPLDGAAGDFNEEISVRELRGEEYGLYRMKLDGGAEETVYPSMPQVRSNSVIDYSTYLIDEENGLIWLAPLEASCTGFGIWEPDLLMMQMGADGKSILTGVFSETGGRILALDADTLTSAAEYTVPGWDAVDLYAVENGRVMGLFRLTDAEKLKQLHETEGLNSRWEYDAYGAFILE